MTTATNTIEEFASKEYEHGFITTIEADSAPPGLSEDIIRFISAKKQEPAWLLDWRLKAYRHWLTLEEPRWWPNVTFAPINYQDIIYYSAPKPKKVLNSLDEVDPELRKTFEKLGIPLDEQKMMPSSASFSLKVVATETLSKTASTATPLSRICSSSEMPSFSNVLRSSGSTSSRLPSCFFGFGAE